MVIFRVPECKVQSSKPLHQISSLFFFFTHRLRFPLKAAASSRGLFITTTIGARKVGRESARLCTPKYHLVHFLSRRWRWIVRGSKLISSLISDETTQTCRRTGSA
ncbi:hypothetical protein CDAR_33741 [Caerostris darwini]|uniref:Uncharacterized protein n=1 Tax=Caerostris darwini TaxID=1538125 RepID=A0AAV4UNE3_9ARAC|nr:hypothetical protein CDAR_33741 [Caerostris darwini]